MVNRLLFKLTLRELWKNWFQYLSTFTITLLAATLFLGFISNTLTLRRRTDLYFEASDLADLIVQTTAFDEGDEEYLSAFGGAELRIFSEGEFSRGEEAHVAKIYVAERDAKRHAPYVDVGEKGFLIDKTVAGLFGYGIGDVLTVDFTTFRPYLDGLAEGILEEYPLLRSLVPDFSVPSAYSLRVTGLMYSVEGVNVYSVSPVFLTPETLSDAVSAALSAQIPAWLGIGQEQIRPYVENIVRGMRNQALIDPSDPDAAKEEIRARFAEKGENNNLVFIYDRDTMESVALLDGEADQSRSMLYVFPVIFFLVSMLVILTNVSRLILRERTNIGTLKALGVGNGRIIFHYATISAIVTFLGCVAGAALGPVIVPRVMTIKYGLVYSMPILSGVLFSVPWTVGVTAFVCALAVLIGVWAARSVIRENPAECMRPKQITYTPRIRRGTGRSKETRHLLLSARMGLRNIRINWGRSLMTVIGVMGCTALLVTSFGMGDTLQHSVDNDYGGLCRFDVNSSIPAASEEEFFSLLDSLQTGGTIERYERLRSYVATVQTGARNKEITVRILPEDSQMANVASGAISEITASQLGLKVGDAFTLAVGSCTVEYTVESVVPTATWNGFFTREDKFTDGCYYQENVWIKTDSPERVRDILNESSGLNIAKTMADRRGEIENLISSTNVMKYTMMTFAILLSVVVLYNLSLLSMRERSREMATLKVLGFGNFDVSFSLLVEILLLTAVGTALGAALGYPLLYLVMKLNELEIMAFLYFIKPISYILAAGGSLLTATAINLFFGFLISKINMTESLKSVE